MMLQKKREEIKVYFYFITFKTCNWLTFHDNGTVKEKSNILDIILFKTPRYQKWQCIMHFLTYGAPNWSEVLVTYVSTTDGLFNIWRTYFIENNANQIKTTNYLIKMTKQRKMAFIL